MTDESTQNISSEYKLFIENFLINVPTHESKGDDNSLWDKGVGEEVLQ